MAITKKVDGLVMASWAKTSPLAPIVRSWAVTVDTTAEAMTVESGLDGYTIPMGGLTVTGSIGAGTVAVSFNGGAAMYTAAAPSLTVPAVNTVVGTSAPGTAASTAKLVLTTGGTVTAGTVYITALMYPIANSAKTPGQGV